MNRIKFLFPLLSLLWLSSCGLDTVWYLDEPVSRLNDQNNNYTTTLNNTDPTYNYAAFYPRSNDDGGDGYFEGTAVYYKIYNTLSSLNSHKSNISSLISSSKAGNSSTTTLINSYKYQPLAFFPNTNDLGSLVFVGRDDSKLQKKVEIRLYTEGDFEACIKIGDVVLKDSGGKPIVPCRVGGQQKGFDFFDHNEVLSKDRTHNDNPNNLKYGILPEKDDDDCNLSDSGDDDGKVYYVKLYAFAVGSDGNFVAQYSRALDLGELYIRP